MKMPELSDVGLYGLAVSVSCPAVSTNLPHGTVQEPLSQQRSDRMLVERWCVMISIKTVVLMPNGDGCRVGAIGWLSRGSLLYTYKQLSVPSPK